MPLWNSTDANTGAPKFLLGDGLKNLATANATVQGNVTGKDAYQNTSSGVFRSGQAIGVFGVDAYEKSNTSGEGPKCTHAGWVRRRQGTGGVISIAIGSSGGGYSGNGFLTITGGGGANANASYIVSGGNIVSVILNSQGYGYLTAPTVVANATNTAAATFTATLGGRAGRKTYEVLVAMGSMSRDANTDDTIFAG